MAQDDAFISLRDVSKEFGPVRAVDHVSMNIGRGEFFSLLGPSGCGKTTLLRLLAGFEAPTTGEIVTDGQPMSPVPPHQRPVNMVFQNYAIFPHLDVRANIAYGMRKAKLPRRELDDLAAGCGYQGKLVLLADPSLDADDCRIEWADGGAERDTGSAWRELEAAIEQLLHASAGQPNDDAASPDPASADDKPSTLAGAAPEATRQPSE